MLPFVLICYAALLGLFEGPAEIACVAAIVAGVITHRRRLHVPRCPILIGIAVWVLAGYAALLISPPAKRISSEDLYRPLLALAYLAGAIAIPRDDPRTLKRLAIAFAAAMVTNATYGFLQLKLGALPLDSLLLKNPKSPQIFVPGHAIDPVAGNISHGLRGLSGLFYNRLKLAHMGVIALALLVLAAIDRRTAKLLRAAAILGGTAIAAAIVLTYARMAFVAFGIALLAVSLLTARSRIALAVVAAAGTGLALLVRFNEHARERFEQAGADLAARRSIFRAAWEMFLDHPLFGVGHGVYRQAASSYYPEGASKVWQIDAHNLFLHVPAETGIVGTLGFFAAVVAALVLLVRRVRAERGSVEAAAFLDRFALFGLLVILALGGTHFPLHHAPVALVFWTFVGVAEGIAWRRTERSDQPQPAVTPAPVRPPQQPLQPR